MKKIASIATHHGREESLKITVKSLRDQVDIIFVTANDYLSYAEAIANKNIDFAILSIKDLTDNAKFLPLTRINYEDYYFFTMDDDLFYAPDYIDNMVKKINEHKCIISHHGRVLRGTGLRYYSGHTCYKCLIPNPHELELDVCGTGVVGFKTSYFKPMIWDAKDQKMSDLVFSLEAAKLGKKIMLIPHKLGNVVQITNDAGIFGEFVKKPTKRQNQIADEIYNLKH